VSLILDALRKADAERERGSVPSLHSQPVATPSAEAPPKASVRPSWLWVAIGIAVGLVGAAAWVMVGREGTSPDAAASRAPTPPAASTTPSAPPATPGYAPPAAAVAPAAAPNSGVGPALAQPAPWPQPDERRAARPEEKGDVPVRVLGNVLTAETQVYSRDQLPPDIRAALPQLTIGGSIYSPNSAGRSLIVNGQLFRERDRLTQDLSLEEIKLKAAIFSFRGYRFEVLF
jgi:general secretion pathway protein B